MKQIRLFFGYDWAMPVKHRGWAIVASFADLAMRASGYRLHGSLTHKPWMRAVTP